jgi:hypothetical protein
MISSGLVSEPNAMAVSVQRAAFFEASPSYPTDTGQQGTQTLASVCCRLPCAVPRYGCTNGSETLDRSLQSADTCIEGWLHGTLCIVSTYHGLSSLEPAPTCMTVAVAWLAQYPFSTYFVVQILVMIRSVFTMYSLALSIFRPADAGMGIRLASKSEDSPS